MTGRRPSTPEITLGGVYLSLVQHQMFVFEGWRAHVNLHCVHIMYIGMIRRDGVMCEGCDLPGGSRKHFWVRLARYVNLGIGQLNLSRK